MNTWEMRRAEAGKKSGAARKANREAKGWYAPDYRWHQMAGRCIKFAKEMGLLPVLDGSIPCVDCGKPATLWEHRDYTRPFDVEPCCIGCNVKRGPGKFSRVLWPESVEKNKSA